MPDRLAYPLLALTAGALILAALVWPQGQGAPTPWLGLAPARSSHALEAQPSRRQPVDPVTALAKKAVVKLKGRASDF